MGAENLETYRTTKSLVELSRADQKKTSGGIGMDKVFSVPLVTSQKPAIFTKLNFWGRGGGSNTIPASIVGWSKWISASRVAPVRPQGNLCRGMWFTEST